MKSTGDGILATFESPAQAIRSSLALREAMRGLDLRMRIGIHTGEVEVRGDDIGGIAVHVGARVMERADSGTIIVSRTVADLVAGSGIEFRDRGEHELRGVGGRWQLFAVEDHLADH